MAGETNAKHCGCAHARAVCMRVARIVATVTVHLASKGSCRPREVADARVIIRAVAADRIRPIFVRARHKPVAASVIDEALVHVLATGTALPPRRALAGERVERHVRDCAARAAVHARAARALVGICAHAPCRLRLGCRHVVVPGIAGARVCTRPAAKRRHNARC